MRKLKLLCGAVIVAMAVVVIAGCDDGGGGGKTLVTGVSINQAAYNEIYYSSTDAQKPSSLTLTATVLPAKASNTKVKWTADSTEYVTVMETNGSAIVTANKIGGHTHPTTITVATVDGDYKDSITVVVLDPSIVPTGVTVQAIATVVIGTPFTLTAKVLPALAGQAVTWTSDDPDTASIDADGVITGKKIGTATITATCKADTSLTATCAVTVANTAVPVTGVTLDITTTSVLIGGAPLVLTATVAPAEVSQAVTWTTSNEVFASVVNGVVTGHSVGTVTITATSVADPTKHATCAVTVTDTGVAVGSVELDEEDVGVALGSVNPLILTATILPTGATNQNVRWESSDPTVATISGTGHSVTINPLKLGTTTIKVTTEDGDKTATCIVRVLPAGSVINVDRVELTPSSTVAVGATVTLSHTVQPTDADNKIVSWSSNKPFIATVANGVVTGVNVGRAIITVTTQDGNKSAECVVTVTGPAALVLYNQAAAPDAATTTSLASAWNDTTKKYTIKNVGGEVVAGGNAGANGVTNATFVYWNTPFATTGVTISARVRIKAMVAATASDTHGVIIGGMNDPTEPTIPFYGLRATTKNSWRPYNSRNNAANSSAAMTAANTSGFEDYNIGQAQGGSNSYICRIDGVAIPFDEEFILETQRTSATAYTVRMKTYAGGSDIATGTYSNNALNGTATVNMDMNYLGFIIANAEVEISQIVIKEGSTTALDKSSDAVTPIPTTVTGVAITGPAGFEDHTGTGGQYSYQHSTMGGATSLTVTAKALPARAPQGNNITWAITGATPATGSGASIELTDLPSDDGATVTAVATAGSGTATLTIHVTTGAITVDELTIAAEGDRNEIMLGGPDNTPPAQTLQFSVTEIGPENAPDKTVTWSVWSNQACTTASAIASISSTGLLTLDATATPPAAANDKIWVKATANDAGAFSSDAIEITVVEYVPPPALLPPQIWRTDIGATQPSGSIDYDSDAETLTMKGMGAVGSSSTKFNFVYLPATGNFTMTVKVESISWGQNNNSDTRVGIIAIPQTGITKDPVTGALTNVPADTALAYAGVSFRSNSSITRIQNIVGGAGIGTSGVGGTAPTTPPGYLRLRRSGNNYYASGGNLNSEEVLVFSTDATATAPALGDDTYVGLFVCSNSGTTTAVFSDLRFSTNGGTASTTGGIIPDAEDDAVDFGWLE